VKSQPCGPFRPQSSPPFSLLSTSGILVFGSGRASRNGRIHFLRGTGHRIHSLRSTTAVYSPTFTDIAYKAESLLLAGDSRETQGIGVPRGQNQRGRCAESSLHLGPMYCMGELASRPRDQNALRTLSFRPEMNSTGSLVSQRCYRVHLGCQTSVHNLEHRAPGVRRTLGRIRWGSSADLVRPRCRLERAGAFQSSTPILPTAP